MHDALFADAARPIARVVLGLRLRTFTVGHEILLLAERNAIACLADEDFNQLALDQQTYALQRAALICSSSWNDHQKAEKRAVQRRFLGFSLNFRLKIDRWTRLWCRANEDANWPLEIAEFKNYLAAGRKTLPSLSSSVPEDKEAYEMANKGEELGGGRSLGAPMLAGLVLFINEHPQLFATDHASRITHHVFDISYAYAMMLFQAHHEEKGNLRVENSEEAQVRAEMAGHRAVIRAEKLEKENREREASEQPPEPSPATDHGPLTTD